mgnify:FL=1
MTRFKDLSPLFDAESVAVIGASPNPAKPSGIMLRFLAESGFDGDIFPVNPKHGTLAGLPCYPSLEELPTVPDVAAIAVPVAAVQGVLEDCARVGVPAAVVMTGGFGEGQTGDEGKNREARLRHLASETGMRVLGPNTVGFVNFSRGMPITFADWYGRASHRSGGVAVVTHSGSMGGLIFSHLEAAQVGVHSWVGLGNETDIDVGDVLAHYAAEPAVHTVCCFLEAVNDGAKFVAALKKARHFGTRVVVIKSGQSEAGQRATLSHTGNLSSSSDVYAAVFRKYGVIQIDSLALFAPVASLLEAGYPLTSSVGIVSASGGACSLVADHLEAAGLTVPSLDESTRQQLSKAIPAYGSHDNPVDVTADVIHRPEILEAALDAVANDPRVGTWVVFGRPIIDRYHEQLVTHRRGRSHNLIACPCVPTEEHINRSLADGGVPVIEDPLNTAKAIAAVVTAAAAPPIPDRPTLGPRHVGGGADPNVLADALSEAGVPLAPSVFVNSFDEALAAVEANEVKFPLAVKIASAKVAHKTEFGAVELNVGDMDALRAAFNRLDRLRRREGWTGPGDVIQLQEMVSGDVELLVGLTQDPDFGPVVTVGLGGVLTEMLADSVVLVPPFDEPEVVSELRRLRGWPLLNGYRGSEGVDLPQLVSLVERLCVTYTRNPWIAEIELNPVIASSAGVAAVDAVGWVASVDRETADG